MVEDGVSDVGRAGTRWRGETSKEAIVVIWAREEGRRQRWYWKWREWILVVL